uniref:L-ascorbate oxidase n=1 Tax=Panagrellus redivivus TaxID=6233 RepID=A0A7E4V6L3_PANRE
MRLLAVLSLFVAGAVCWQHYERPIEIAKPNEDGIYEFELVVSHRMTMTRHLGPFHKAGVVDYEVETGVWMQRDSNQLSDCNDTAVLLDSDVSSDEKERVLGDLVQLDGLHHRMIMINGNTPGNTIVVPLGAEVVLKVKNRLNTESITLHVHGLDKRGLWWTDGVSHIQQCPIVVGSDYTYRFIADAPGTHWYHGHLNTDRGEGLLGGFVVKNPGETVPHPTRNGERLTLAHDYYVLLQDWAIPIPAEQHYNLADGTMKWVSGMDGERRYQCWAPTRTWDGSNVGGSVPISGFLMGSKGWHRADDLRTQPSKVPLATYLINKDGHALFRFVNGAVAQQIVIWLEDHQFTIVAADGVEVRPRTVDALSIFSGERYDVIVTAKSNPKRRVYRFILETLESLSWAWEPYSHFVGLGNLEYNDSSLPIDDNVDWTHTACTSETKCKVFNCPFGNYKAELNFTCVSPDELENAAGVTDAEIVQSGFNESVSFEEYFLNMHFDSHVDGYMFSKPRGMPYYHDSNLDTISKKCHPGICERSTASKYDHSCDCFFHYKFKLNSIVQMTIYNMGDGGKAGTGYSHPLHLHGTHFWVMKIGFPEYFDNGTISTMNVDLPCNDTTLRCLDLEWSNSTWKRGNIPDMRENPSYRDTILIPTGGYTVIRFRADNPGWWFAHCHLMLHHMGGVAFAYRIGEHSEIPPPPVNFPHDCGNFDVLTINGTAISM